MEQIRAITDPELLEKHAQSDDLLVIMRPVKNNMGAIVSFETHTIKAQDFVSSILLPALSELAHQLPRTNPGDGVSLWLDNGTIRIASNNPSDLGTMSPHALEQSLKNLLVTLPTSPPSDGGPWLDNGVLVFANPKKNNGCC